MITIAVPTVRAAAIKLGGQVYALPAPKRHHDIIRWLVESRLAEAPVLGEQGFVLSDGRFVNRSVARAHAEANDQLLERAIKSKKLYSEDVW